MPDGDSFPSAVSAEPGARAISGTVTQPVQQGAPISPIFNIFGAPIAVLGGVFSGGLPLGGPVAQVFRGGSAPQPPTLYYSTLTTSGPIGVLLLGAQGAPIGVQVIGGGALPIGLPPEAAVVVQSIQPRTAEVGAAPAAPGVVVPPIVTFGPAAAAVGVPAIGAAFGFSSGSAT